MITSHIYQSRNSVSLAPRHSGGVESVRGLRRGLVDHHLQSDEAGEVLPAVADGHHVAHDVGQLVSDVVFDGDGRNVFSAGCDNQFLDAAGDRQKAVAVVPISGSIRFCGVTVQ